MAGVCHTNRWCMQISEVENAYRICSSYCSRSITKSLDLNIWAFLFHNRFCSGKATMSHHVVDLYKPGKPYLPPKYFSSPAPFAFVKEKFLLGAWCMVSFSYFITLGRTSPLKVAKICVTLSEGQRLAWPCLQILVVKPRLQFARGESIFKDKAPAELRGGKFCAQISLWSLEGILGEPLFLGEARRKQRQIPCRTSTTWTCLRLLRGRTWSCNSLGAQNWTRNIFFSNFSGASGISQQNPGISRQKSLIPWVSRDIPNFLAPTPSRGRPPPHQKISGLKSLGLGSFFVPDSLEAHERQRKFNYLNSCRSCFSGVHLIFEVFQDAGCSNKEEPSAFWNATMSCPFRASDYANSYLVPDLVLDADHALDFLSYLVLQACISRFVVFQTKVAHLCFFGHF